ncbi:MAG: hypothetical protein RLO50_01475 [Azospirillaceae bacterium]
MSPPPDAAAASRAAARLFATPDGLLLLAHLRRLTVERVLGPDAGDAALRFLEGQRALVRRLETLIATGREPPVGNQPDTNEKETVNHG